MTAVQGDRPPLERLTASIVIPVWNQWEVTKACLDSLRPTLGVRDEVIVVDNGSEDGTAAGLKAYPWLKVITNEQNRGFAIACNQGAAAATRDVVVLLNNDTLVPRHWMDGLLAPFADPTVGATGPRSNFVSGPQLVDEVGYSIGRMPELRRFARDWQQRHRGQTTEVTRLVGFCLAVRTEAFRQVDGFDEGFAIGGFEDDDLCTRLVGAGWRLLITHDSFVHHHGHVTFDGNGLDWFAIQNSNKERYLDKHVRRSRPAGPLLSAALIVKDEEENLPRCLESLTGLVDEIVVYDTGSTDRTVEIAEAAGATVIRGYWDDDFSRARNAALAACRSPWVLSIDADEVIEADAPSFRDFLASDPPLEVGAIEIRNMAGSIESPTIGISHHHGRLLRREHVEWQNRLHEQVVARPGLPKARTVVLHGIEIAHYGYTNEAVFGRDKVGRNIRIAEAGVDRDQNESAVAVLNLARSLYMGGRNEEALARFAQVRTLDPEPPLRRAALAHGIEVLLGTGRVDEALEWTADLASCSENQSTARYFKGVAHLILGQYEEAAELFEGIEDLETDDGVTYPTTTLQVRRGLVRIARGDWRSGIDEILPVAADPDVIDPIWAPLLEAHWRLGEPVAPLAALVPPAKLIGALAQLVRVSPEAGDAFAEALHTLHPGDTKVLAFAARIAPALGIERAMEWSARLRQAGVISLCPLLAIAADPARPGPERIVAAAAAKAAFAEPKADRAVRHAAGSVSPDAFEAVLVQVNDIMPALLPVFIQAAADSAERANAMADVLARLGAAEEADAVRGYAAETFAPTA